MNEEIIGIEVSGEVYPIKDEGTSEKTQTLESKVQELETLVDTHEEEIKKLDPTWKLFGQTLGKTPIAISKCNELMITFYYEDAGIIINIPILYTDTTQTVRHFCNSFNRSASLQLDADISATTSEVAINSAMWAGSDVSSVCGITVRYR